MSEPLTERIITPMSPSLVEAIDDYRFANRVASRSEAIRQLLLAGLSANSSAPAGTTLSSLLLAAYTAKPTTSFGFNEGTTPEEAVKLEFPPYPKRRAQPLDSFEISSLIKVATRQLETWSEADGPEAAAICDLIRPLTE